MADRVALGGWHADSLSATKTHPWPAVVQPERKLYSHTSGQPCECHVWVMGSDLVAKGRNSSPDMNRGASGWRPSSLSAVGSSVRALLFKRLPTRGSRRPRLVVVWGARPHAVKH